ncbi:DNA polymerase III subunit chi [Sulfuriferula thiophila]|uniref:DNA polymerase III subunit chi n=1 Tax=Sulfuriferula thiophila TaxID=1781211 RepID=UPI000F60A526|nr:DNA polymerase III subunit chi [Sulfuriferula thiophila]
MTRVDFYSNAPDKLELARSLVNKAYRQGLSVMIHSTDAQILADIDQRLWAAPATGFLPHCATDAAHAAQTPVVLGADIGDLSHTDVLINLNDTTPSFFSRFERLIEIVSLDETDRETARQRWIFYKQRGYALTNHDMSKK